ALVPTLRLNAASAVGRPPAGAGDDAARSDSAPIRSVVLPWTPVVVKVSTAAVLPDWPLRKPRSTSAGSRPGSPIDRPRSRLDVGLALARVRTGSEVAKPDRPSASPSTVAAGSLAAVMLTASDDDAESPIVARVSRPVAVGTPTCPSVSPSSPAGSDVAGA